jgi:putative peptidoglycan lipid II flippase
MTVSPSTQTKVSGSSFYAALRMALGDNDSRNALAIAIMVLVFTQVLNWLLVPYLAHAALTLSIGLGALLNALSLLVGLRRQGKFQPLPGWNKLLGQVLLASAVLGALLYSAGVHWDWTALQAQALWRVSLMTLVLAGSAVVYFAALRGFGVNLRALWRR